MYKYLFITLLFLSLRADAQGLANAFDVASYKHTITYQDYKAVFQLQQTDFYSNKPETDKNYYWYSNNQIKITQGGYSGRLLNGNYKAYYLDNNLKEQGIFENGLKNGEWLKWTPQGKIYEKAYFKEGVLHGPFSKYNALGNIQESGNYRNGKIKGVWKSFLKPDSILLTHYKNGVIYTRKVNLLKRILTKKQKPVEETKK